MAKCIFDHLKIIYVEEKQCYTFFSPKRVFYLLLSRNRKTTSV